MCNCDQCEERPCGERPCAEPRKMRYEIRYEREDRHRTIRHRVETDDPVEFDAHLGELIRGPDGGHIVSVRIGDRKAILCWVHWEDA